MASAVLGAALVLWRAGVARGSAMSDTSVLPRLKMAKAKSPTISSAENGVAALNFSKADSSKVLTAGFSRPLASRNSKSARTALPKDPGSLLLVVGGGGLGVAGGLLNGVFGASRLWGATPGGTATCNTSEKVTRRALGNACPAAFAFAVHGPMPATTSSSVNGLNRLRTVIGSFWLGTGRSCLTSCLTSCLVTCSCLRGALFTASGA